MICVTCLASHVMCHMSPVTCHMSHVKFLLSTVTWYMSPVTCYLSSVSCHLFVKLTGGHLFYTLFLLSLPWGWRGVFMLLPDDNPAQPLDSGSGTGLMESVHWGSQALRLATLWLDFRKKRKENNIYCHYRTLKIVYWKKKNLCIVFIVFESN